MGYTLWLCQHSYSKWQFIVDLPIENGDFSIVMLVYQRVVVIIIKIVVRILVVVITVVL